MKHFIYADNAATTKLDIDAFEAMKPYLLEEYGNASQPYSFARKPKQALKVAREIIASCINADPDEIYFTSGGTEADNWAIKGIVFNNLNNSAVITTQIEHHAVLRACESLEKLGSSIIYLPCNNDGIVTSNALSSAITQGTNLVSVMMVNNEIGTIQPIKELCDISHDNGALFHTDAVQAVGHISIDVKALGVDLLSASAHKFNGPKGVGFLYIKKGTIISPYVNGGSQEFGMRAGTENVATIVGMAVALKKACESLDMYNEGYEQLRSTFLNTLFDSGVDFIINGETFSIPNIISVSIKDVSGETILHRLDLMGIAISTGSACDSVNDELSHVVKAIGLSDKYAYGTIRISFGKDNTIEDAINVAKAIIKVVKG